MRLASRLVQPKVSLSETRSPGGGDSVQYWRPTYAPNAQTKRRTMGVMTRTLRCLPSPKSLSPERRTNAECKTTSGPSCERLSTWISLVQSPCLNLPASDELGQGEQGDCFKPHCFFADPVSVPRAPAVTAPAPPQALPRPAPAPRCAQPPCAAPRPRDASLAATPRPHRA
jgi:hypothetical protein